MSRESGKLLETEKESVIIFTQYGTLSFTVINCFQFSYSFDEGLLYMFMHLGFTVAACTDKVINNNN